MFALLLRSLARHDLITQGSDGLLLLGVDGERQVNHYSFYAAFRSPEEYRLIATGRPLGTLPVSSPIQRGDLIVFAGQRWRIEDIDDRDKTIEVVRSSGGRPPRFEGNGAAVSEKVRRRMREVYLNTVMPIYLDPTASELLAEGRRAFHRYDLADKSIVASGSETHLLVWHSDRAISTLAIILARHGLEVSHHGMILTAATDETTVTTALRSAAAKQPPNGVELANLIGNKVVEKWDEVLDDELLNLTCARRDLDAEGAWTALAQLAYNAG